MKESSEGTKKNTIKRITAAIFGKMLELKEDEPGELCNPVWAAETEVNTRLEVASFVIISKINPIHIAVDGVVSPVPVSTGDRCLGSWGLSNISPCICTGTGAVATRDDGIGEFHLKYDWLKSEIDKNPDATEYKMTKLVPVSLAEACNGKMDKLGTLQELTKVISIGQGEKRCYKEQPKTGRDLISRTYQSKPWDISLIKGLKEI